MAPLRCLLWCISETLLHKISAPFRFASAYVECWCPSWGYFLAALGRPLASQLLGLRLGCVGYGLLQRPPAKPPIGPAPGLPLLSRPSSTTLVFLAVNIARDSWGKTVICGTAGSRRSAYTGIVSTLAARAICRSVHPPALASARTKPPTPGPV